MSDGTPIAVGLDEFLNLPIEEKPPLLGHDGEAAIVAGGLILLGGQAGLGKTTLIVDAIFHLAAGLDWLTFKCGKPLNILVIENEGPLRMFQQKLAAKRKVWKHPLHGQIHVQTGAWGWFSFAEPVHHAQVAEYLHENNIDLVIGDPIGTLGMEGVGSPEDTRNFVRLLIPLGLFDTRAFWFPVHFTKEPRKDEINQISGAWGGHLDTLMVLKATRRKDELRLSFPKLRWWNTNPPAPMILGKVYNTHTFELLRHEGDQEPLEERIIERLEHGDWITAQEIASKTGGIEGGARIQDVKLALEARPDLFHWESGADHGRSAKAVLWALVPGTGTSQTPKTAQPSRKPLVPALWDESDESNVTDTDSLVRDQRDEWDESNQTAPPDTTTNSSQPPPYRGQGTSTESDDHEPFPDSGTSRPTNGLDRLQAQRAWITNGGWTNPDLTTALLEHFPHTNHHDLPALAALAAKCQANEFEGHTA